MTAGERYYLTTAIFYPAPKPALHSMFEAIGADVIARYERLRGRDVRFLTGLDEHSAYQLASIAANVAVTQLVDGKMGVHVRLPKSIFVGKK